MAEVTLYNILSGLYTNDSKLNEKITHILTGLLGITDNLTGTNSAFANGVPLIDSTTGKLNEAYATVTVDIDQDQLVAQIISKIKDDLLSASYSDGKVIIGTADGIKASTVKVGSETLNLNNDTGTVGEENTLMTEKAFNSYINGENFKNLLNQITTLQDSI